MPERLFRLAALAPLPLAHAFGSALGALAWVIPNSFSRRTRFHIARCMPGLGRFAREALALRALRESGKALAELPILFAGSPDRVAGLVREVHGGPLLDAAVASGKGVIAASPHLGSWEMAGLAYSRLHRIVTMYRPQDEPWDAIIKAGRGRFGAELVASDRGGMRRLLETLHAGGSVGVLPDQDPPPGSGVFAPFFGIIAHSPTFATRLARRTGAAILYVYAERLSWGRGFVLHIDEPPREVAAEDDVRAVTALNCGVEERIRKFPAQYYWAYMRFRRRPPGEPAFYPW